MTLLAPIFKENINVIEEKDIDEKTEIAYWTFFLKVRGKEVTFEYLDNHNHTCPTCRTTMKEKGSFFATLNPNNLHRKNPQESISEDTNNSLMGHTIFVVGGMSQKDNYKKVIENNGGVFIWLDGKEKKTRIRSRVKKADIVLWISEEMSHQGMYPTKEYCKEYGVQFKAMESKGASSLLRQAKELMSYNITK